jgi:hypothetical protein
MFPNTVSREGVYVADIDEPSGRQPPPSRPGSGSDLSTAGFAKVGGGCCLAIYFLYSGIGFIVISQWEEFFYWIGLPLLVIGLLWCIAGLLAIILMWKVLKGS